MESSNTEEYDDDDDDDYHCHQEVLFGSHNNS